MTNVHIQDSQTATPSYNFDNLLYTTANSDDERKRIDLIREEYPVKISPYLERLIKRSPYVAKQFIPTAEEYETVGTATPFEEGKHATGVYGLERVYRDRVLMTPHFDCPAYCRFCYKKSRVLRGQKGMSKANIDQAMEYIANDPEIRGVLITGGDPMMDLDKLFYLLDAVSKVDSVHEIRIGSRSFLANPTLFTDALAKRLSSYNRVDFNNAENSQSLAFNVHFNHPDELTPEVLHACNAMISNGIMLRNQAVLLKGINDDLETMTRLFKLLLRNRIIPYYMNHCMPVVGGDHLRPSVAKGQEILRHLHTESSSAIPNYVYAPQGGKVHVGADTEFEYKYRDGKRYIVVKMLYKTEEFQRITKEPLPPHHKTSDDGYIVAEYLDGSD